MTLQEAYDKLGQRLYNALVEKKFPEYAGISKTEEKLLVYTARKINYELPFSYEGWPVEHHILADEYYDAGEGAGPAEGVTNNEG